MTHSVPELRPVGPQVDATPARRPELRVLQGQYITLEPLDAAKHAPDLWCHVQDADQVWDYLFDRPFADEQDFRADLERKAASSDPLFWAIIDNASRQAVGYCSLMRIEPVHRAIEVGNILFTPALQRRPGATEAMFLLASLVFDELGYRRYEWKCNALNAPSRSAAVRLGFTFEGVFRQHMIVKGRNRDTAWFSMLDTEWPPLKQAFEAWLASENFDAEGRQKWSLANFRG